MYTRGTLANSQMTPTKLSKNGVVAKVRILVEQVSHLKTFRIAFNEMPVLLFILCWRYFSCLQLYSENFLTFSWANVFSNFCGKGRHRSVFWEMVQFYKNSGIFINRPPSFLDVTLRFLFKSIFQKNENRFISLRYL